LLWHAGPGSHLRPRRFGTVKSWSGAGKAPPVRAGQVRGGRTHEVSCWDILDVSESFAGGCRVANRRLKNRTERAISLSNASGRRPTTDPARSPCYSKRLTLILRCDQLSLAPAHPPSPSGAGPTTISKEDNELSPTRMVDMSFLLPHPGFGEVGRDADELSGRRNPRKRDDVGRHGAPT
jgi:hypothetical protein